MTYIILTYRRENERFAAIAIGRREIGASGYSRYGE